MITASVREHLHRWLLALAVFALLIFFFSPAWSAFSLGARIPEMRWLIEVRRGFSVWEQVDHLGGKITDPLHRVIQWRLAFPVVAHVFHLPPVALFSLAPLGCGLVLGYLFSLLRRQNLTWSLCILSVVTLGAASWFFTSTGWLGYYDSWLAFGLLILAFSPAPWVVWLACIWAPWVDERFVIAAPLALICRYVFNLELRSEAAAGATAHPIAPTRRIQFFGIPSALILAFVGIRLGLLQDHSAEGATVRGYLSGRHFLDAPLARIALGLWDGLRAGWLFVFAAVFLLRSRPLLAFLVGVAVIATAATGLATAQDYSRSQTMLFPAAVLGALVSARHLDRANGSFAFLAVSAASALALPAHHVMNDQVRPIFYLYHELASFENPPASAMPEVYELRAIHDMERGDFANAEAYLSLAIKLAPNPASPCRQRGILYASQGRWPEALRDFSSVVEHDASNPDAWFLRAQAESATGAQNTARSDIDHALSLAPNGWSQRPDVTRFLAKLNAAER